MEKKTVKIEHLVDVAIDINEVIKPDPLIKTEDSSKEKLIEEINDIITQGLIKQLDIEDFVEETKETLELLKYNIEDIESHIIEDTSDEEIKDNENTETDKDGCEKEEESDDIKNNGEDKEVKEEKPKNKKEIKKEKVKKKVEKKKVKREVKKEDRYTRADAFVDSLKNQTGKFTYVDISEESDKLFVEKTSKNSSYNGAKNYAVFALPVLLRLGIVSKEGSKYTYIGE